MTDIEKKVYGNTVQLFRRDAGDDLAHIFTFQCLMLLSGQYRQMDPFGFVTRFAFRMDPGQGTRCPPRWHRMQDSNLRQPVLETGALPAERIRHEKTTMEPFRDA